LDPKYISASRYAPLLAKGEPLPSGKISPLALADTFEQESAQVLALLEGLKTDTSEAFLQETSDLKAWSALGRYTANKMRAAVSLAQYRLDHKPEHKEAAKVSIKTAITHWEELARITDEVYRTVPLTHLHYYEPGRAEWARVSAEDRARFEVHEDNYFSWKKLLPYVRKDLDLIEKAQ
jgi:hypothetical protein